MPKKSKLTLLISDLHLEEEKPEITQAFLSFIENRATQAEALYILGDFFNVWIGDDNDSPFIQQISSILKNLADSGTKLFLMYGNRDFLMGKAFAKKCGATLIFEPYSLQCYSQDYLLMHGDSLCTLDEDYMQFRDMVRDEQWQTQFLSQSIEQRQGFADQARAQSKSMSSNKAEDIMDVTQTEVLALMNTHNVTTLIHGHTHRPAVHQLTLHEGHSRTRIVLGDWDKGESYITLSAREPRLVY